MFFTLSYTTHVLISIFLHVSGVCAGLFIWYLFPRNPTKTITRMPLEKTRLIVSEENEISSEDEVFAKKSPSSSAPVTRLIRTSG